MSRGKFLKKENIWFDFRLGSNVNAMLKIRRNFVKNQNILYKKPYI